MPTGLKGQRRPRCNRKRAVRVMRIATGSKPTS